MEGMRSSSRRNFLRGLATLAAGASALPLSLPGRPGAALAGENLPPPGSPTLAAIKQRQRLRAAVLVGSAPFASMDQNALEVRALAAADPPPLYPATGGHQVVGLDADLAAAAAKLLGVQLELCPVSQFDALFDMLGRRDADIALGGLSRTAARATALAFSLPYLTSGQELFTLEDRRFASLAEVNKPEVRLGVRDGATGQSFALRELGRAHLCVFPSIAELFAGLWRHDVDVVVADGPVGRDFALRRKLTLFSVEKRRVTTEAIAIAARQGDGDFVEFLSLLIHELRQTGEFMRLARRYQHWLRVDR